MRINRNIRIGAAIVALALLGLGLITIFRNLRGAGPTTVATNTTQPTPDAADNAAVAPVSSDLVAFAREDIPERSIVTPEMMEMRAGSPGAQNATFVTDMGEQAVGFITSRPITRGAQVRRADFLGHVSDVGIAGALLPGRRAMILPIANKSTLHDLVRIGDRVDIVASFEQQEARTIAEDVRVLAVDVFGKDFPQVKVAMRGDYKASQRSISSAVPPSPSGVQSTGGANPDAPPGQQPQPAQGQAQGQAGSGQAPGPGATPEPTATQGPPPARPDPALTIEVTPQQATDIALTQAAGQNIDFLLRPRSEPRLPGAGAGALGGVTLAGGAGAAGTPGSQAVSIRERLAPYAARARRSAGSAGAGAGAGASAGASGGSGGASRPTRSARSDEASTARPARRSRLDAGSLPYAAPDLPSIPPARDLPPARLDGLPAGQPAAASERPATPPATYDIPIYGDGKLVRVDTVKRPRQ